jgi:hypothetical protein
MIFDLKVPFLAAARIETAAQAVLRNYAAWKGKPVSVPIDVENILEGFFGLDIAYIDLSDFFGMPGVLGATLFNDRRVLVDESLMTDGKEGRLAFTLAHEGGHWQLHRPLIRSAQMQAPLFAKAGVKKAPAEWQADKFAACLLMPADNVRTAAKQALGRPLAIDNLTVRRKSGELIAELRAFAAEVIERGKFSNVSNEAMRYRLLALKLVVDASTPQKH